VVQTHARSLKGTRALKYQNNLNAERYSLIPVISIYRMIALTVLDNCLHWKDFEHFLKWHLVSLLIQPSQLKSFYMHSQLPRMILAQQSTAS
ncbi:hypothetical protein PSTT_04464, partial [Puccinia striiformis]